MMKYIRYGAGNYKAHREGFEIRITNKGKRWHSYIKVPRWGKRFVLNGIYPTLWQAKYDANYILNNWTPSNE